MLCSEGKSVLIAREAVGKLCSYRGISQPPHCVEVGCGNTLTFVVSVETEAVKN